MNHHSDFYLLHQTEQPLLLGNCWDVNSAQQLEAAGFKAIGTSSWAVAKTLGFDDGEQLSFDQLYQIVQQIKQHTSIPLTVDLERGYSNTTAGILNNIHALYNAGVAGINIEDSTEAKSLQPATAFASLLTAIKNYCSQHHISMFINARTDSFLLQHPQALATTLERIKIFEAAGADGIFVPFMTGKEDIETVTGLTALPVNVLANPELPPLNELYQLGVKRVSMGAALFRAVNINMQQILQQVNQNQSLQLLFNS